MWLRICSQCCFLVYSAKWNWSIITWLCIIADWCCIFLSFRYFPQILSYPKIPMRKPTLFQHMGEHSSLTSKKLNKLKVCKTFWGGGGREQLNTFCFRKWTVFKKKHFNQISNLSLVKNSIESFICFPDSRNSSI